MIPNCVKANNCFLHASEFEGDAEEHLNGSPHLWVKSHNFFDRMAIATTTKIGLHCGQKLKRVPEIY